MKHTPATPEQANEQLRIGLSLIKQHITEAGTQQDRDLHAAVQSIVTGARAVGLLPEGFPAFTYRIDYWNYSSHEWIDTNRRYLAITPGEAAAVAKVQLGGCSPLRAVAV